MQPYKTIDDKLFSRLKNDAKNSPRKRSHYNLHENLDDPVQRLCIALHPGSYLRPHRHPEEYKWEMMLALQGQIHLAFFDGDGRLLEKIQLSEQGPVHALEVPPNTWHSLFTVDKQAVIMEIKQGPYVPLGNENFASWAPEEGTAEVSGFLQWCRNSKPGDRYSQ